MKLEVDGIELYRAYGKYWVSRYFVDMYGYGFLTNNFKQINRILKWSDMGQLKRIAWILIDLAVERDDIEGNTERLNTFATTVQSLDEASQKIINYHLSLCCDGLLLRKSHFERCSQALQAFSALLKEQVLDNIYGLGVRFGKYTPNFFEETLIHQFPTTVSSFANFIEVLKTERPDITILNADIEYDFDAEECSC